MTVFFTSDTHYGHVNIIEYCDRPFSSVTEMDEELIRRHNAVVKAGDHVFHLGDFAMGRDQARRVAEIRSRLNGTYTLVLGNHDRKAKFYLDRGFERVLDVHGVLAAGRKIQLQHRPLGYNDPCGADLVLCGHVHEKWRAQRWATRPRPVQVNVGVDQWAYAPVTLEELIAAEAA